MDDSPGDAERARRALSGDYDTRVFHEGSTALEQLAAGARPDVVVLDWIMPEMSGLDFCWFVRSRPQLAGLQILLLLFAAVTLGGLGTAFGALIGALVIGLVVEVSPVLGMPGDFKYATALLILIPLLLVRPQGLLGKPQRIG